MALSEQTLIERWLAPATAQRADVEAGIGDDCAVLRVPPGRRLAVSMDTLVEGVHFVEGVDAESLGHKALAVNLSDLAAMAAEPAWATLSLTLPRVDETWLEGFAAGFSGLARRYGVQLVGGDLTRGPLSVTVQAHGFTDPSAALRRGGARAGDLVYVTGTLGDAGLALLAQQGLYVEPRHLRHIRTRMERPEPRIDEARALRDLATAAIDLSDGLAADLGRICRASAAGATLELERLPTSEAVRTYAEESGDLMLALAAGDDYELCVTIPPDRQGLAEELGGRFGCGLTWIGLVERTPGLRCRYPDGRLEEAPGGYDHFAGDD